LRAPVPLDAALWQRPLATLGPIPPPAVGPVESPTRAGAALDPPRVRTPDASPSTLSPERLPADPVADPVRLPPRVVVQYLEPPVPDYPSLSRRLGETGRVLVRVDIDAEGRTREVALLRSSGYPRLDEAALRAVRKARFRPHVEGGEPIAAWTTVPIVFALETT
ncbi:MAG: TonB family protein, partial [Pseudomonadota bacterium]|nr:TonB family protein [Pseudomonadota bacterium]